MSDLDDLTTNELRARAKDLGVPIISQLRKGQLVAAILTAEGEPEEDVDTELAPKKRKGIERYTVLIVSGMCAVEDGVLGRIHDGWWDNNPHDRKGLSVAITRCAAANQNDVYTGLSDEQRAENTAAGLEQFVNSG